MVLADLIPSAQDHPGGDTPITALAYDDRRVGPGTLFFCVPGLRSDGHDFAPSAVARGAAALVAERPLGLGVPEVVVDDVRAAMALAAAAFADHPTRDLSMVGVTGTNGKTTIAYLIRALLTAAGRATGLVGTVETIVGGAATPAVRTTPEAIDLQAAFAAMRAAGDVACVMEVSSHALQLRRVDAIAWDVAVFTNLTQDHLDFHPTMDEYFAVKSRLFTAGPAVAVVNIDDPYGRQLADGVSGVVTYGIESPDAALRASAVTFDLTGSTFLLDGRRWTVGLPGRFNVLNALAAIATARALDVDDDTIAAALAGAGQVPGRFQGIDEGQDFAVLVDYAHTPDSLENVLNAAREVAAGRVGCVVGCGGDRDRGKRPQMAAIAERAADWAILTSDNPRSESPEAILAEMVAGLSRPDAVEVIVDRREAIGRAIAQATTGDVVVIAGKGHEQGQDVGGTVTPFDDVTEARNALHDAANVGHHA